MTIIIFTIMIACVAAFVYINILHAGYMGTLVPVIISSIIGFVWIAGAVIVLCNGKMKSGLTALVMGIGMFARAYIEYRTWVDVQEFSERWGIRD